MRHVLVQCMYQGQPQLMYMYNLAFLQITSVVICCVLTLDFIVVSSFEEYHPPVDWLNQTQLMLFKTCEEAHPDRLGGFIETSKGVYPDRLKVFFC